MKVLTFQIELLQDVLAPGLEGDPNSSVSYPFLPGSALRGMVIGRYLRSQGRSELGDVPEKRQTEQRLFLSEDTRFLNGYLAPYHDYETRRSLPAPLAWHEIKEERSYNPDLCPKSDEAKSSQTVFDFAVEAPAPGGDQPWLSPAKPFMIAAGGAPAFVNPHKQINIHTTRNRDYGRAIGGDGSETLAGAVYRYESIARGQEFIAHVLCQNDDEETLKELLDGTHKLGGSRGTDYGRVRVSLISSDDLDQWSEIGEAELPNEEIAGDTAIVTLLSDALIRGRRGQYATDPGRLAEVLGFQEHQLTRAYIRHRPVGGFNRKWGLPLPQIPAFKMGSVLIFNDVTAEQMAGLKKQSRTGIGGGLEDGFGRIAVNWHGAGQLEGTTDLDGPEYEDKNIKDEATRVIAQAVVDRLQVQRLATQINAAANRLAHKQRALSRSQIYRLQTEIARSLNAVQASTEHPIKDEKENIEKYLAGLKKRSATQRQFSKARIDNKPILDWIQERVTDEEANEVQKILDIHRVPEIGGIKAAWNDRLIFEANLRLVNEVLLRMGKLSREDR